MPHSVVTQVCCSQRPCPCGRPLLTFHSRLSNTQRQVWISLCQVWCTQGSVLALRATLAGMTFDSKCDFTPPTILLGLLLCPWMWSIFFWWDPTFSYRWLFANEFSQEKMSTHPFTLPSWVCRSEATVRTGHGTTD